VFPEIDPPPETIDQVPPAGAPVNVLVSPSVIAAVVVVLSATTSQTGVTVKVTSSVVATQAPSAAIVYRILTVVFVLILAGVYVEPEIAPPPETIEKVPPEGEPVNVFVPFPVIDAEEVVLLATGQGVTVKLTSEVEAKHVPLAAIVYLIVTFVVDVTFAAVYVFPEIVPPPETIVQVPPEGEPVNVFVPFPVIDAEEVVLLATGQGVTVKLTSEVEAKQVPLAAIVYLKTTVVVAVTFAAVYVLPEIAPPPETIENVPPEGEPTNVFVPFPVIEAEEVVLLATGQGVTVKLTSEVEAKQVPLAAIVYLKTTVVVVVTFAAVYVLPEIDPPPETIDQVPPEGEPTKVLV
jgi:cold shock CspA family protein